MWSIARYVPDKPIALLLLGATPFMARLMPKNIKPLSNGALLVVVVGSTFHDQLAPIAVPQPPTRHPPNVRRDPGESRSTLFRLRKRLPFTLEYPTLLERSSYLDSGYSETPVRIYPLEGQPTIRLTFRTGSNEYWGIQETRWADAPARYFGERTSRTSASSAAFTPATCRCSLAASDG